MKHILYLFIAFTVVFLIIQCRSSIKMASGPANEEAFLCQNADDWSHIQGSIILPLAGDVPGVENCSTDSCRMAVIRAFLQTKADSFSWKSFISINWLAKPDGTPDSDVCFGSQHGVTVWEYWMPTSNIYKETPDTWESGINKKTNRPVNADEVVDHMLLAKESDLVDINAEDKPVIDQNGNPTLFEIYYNKQVYDYIMKGKLYSESGQREFANSFPSLTWGISATNNKTGQKLNIEDSLKAVYFPVGNAKDSSKVIGDWTFDFTTNQGAVVVKTAWRQMTAKDDISKYHTRKVKVDENGTQTLGLVGMHLIHKVAESTQWIWSTFQHVDNAPEMGEDGRPVIEPGKQYSYFDSENLGAPINQPPPKGWALGKKKDMIPVQLVQEVPTTDAVDALNAHYHKLITDVNPNSYWQYYEMVGTQWPFDPNLLTKGLDYTPKILANAVMETYGQTTSSCMSCHAKARFLYNRETSLGYSSDFLFTLNIED